MNDRLTVTLVGNPAVGKSTLFSRLTGIGVIVSNYPGTTVEVARGRVTHDAVTLDLADLPGVYALDAGTPEARTLLDYLRAEKPDAILNVVDATRLERNLYLTLQMLELGIPVIVALNMVDEARALGMDIDVPRLAAALGVPVVATSAHTGEGLEELMHTFREPYGSPRLLRFDRHIEAAISQMRDTDPTLGRHDAAAQLSGTGDASQYVEPLRARAAEMRETIERTHGQSISDILASNRYGDAGLISRNVMRQKQATGRPLRERIDDILVLPAYGFAILALVMLSMLLVVFLAGGLLGDVINSTFDTLILTPVSAALTAHAFLQVIVRYILIGVQAGLGIVVPYIMTFHLCMSVLENTGYLTRAAFLLDETMHKLKLHGRAMIPLFLGLGCSVPAIMSTKMLQSRRERVITCAMICMVPCSARSIVIMGLVARFVSISAALSIYLFTFVMTVAVGYLLGKTVKGEETGFVLEMVPLRRPCVRDVIYKTWLQMKDFVYVAFPLLIAGSAVLGLLQYAGILQIANGILSPVTSTWMGLPSYTATALVFGILRKEMALETLAVMAGVSVSQFGAALTGLQMYTFALFTTIYMPCLATIAVLKRVLGRQETMLITALTIALALVISGLVAHLVPLWDAVQISR